MTKWLQFLKLFSEKNQHLTEKEVLQKAKVSFMKLTKYYEQYGGGNCSLCGSPDTNKSTCPLNQDAKNPNPAKHPNASGAAVPAPAALVRAKTPVAVSEQLSEIRNIVRLMALSEKQSSNYEDVVKLLVSDHGVNPAFIQEQKTNIRKIISQGFSTLRHTPDPSVFQRHSAIPSAKCVEQHTKKYTERDSPPFPANECCGVRMLGNPKGKDSDKYFISIPDINRVCRWKLSR